MTNLSNNASCVFTGNAKWKEMEKLNFTPIQRYLSTFFEKLIETINHTVNISLISIIISFKNEKSGRGQRALTIDTVLAAQLPNTVYNPRQISITRFSIVYQPVTRIGRDPAHVGLQEFHRPHNIGFTISSACRLAIAIIFPINVRILHTYNWQVVQYIFTQIATLIFAHIIY